MRNKEFFSTSLILFLKKRYGGEKQAPIKIAESPSPGAGSGKKQEDWEGFGERFLHFFFRLKKGEFKVICVATWHLWAVCLKMMTSERFWGKRGGRKFKKNQKKRKKKRKRKKKKWKKKRKREQSVGKERKREETEGKDQSGRIWKKRKKKRISAFAK